MKRLTLKIEGISPLLMNNPATMRPREQGGKLGTDVPTPEVEAAAKVYKLANGDYCIPASWILGALQTAAKGRKIGKFTARAVVSGSVFTVQETYPLLNPDTLEPIRLHEVDARRAVVQGKGVIRGRPKIPRWLVHIELEYDEEMIKPDVIDELADIAGRVAGLGDFAPHDNGPFGRFRLLDWTKPKKAESPAAADAR